MSEQAKKREGGKVGRRKGGEASKREGGKVWPGVMMQPE